MKVIYGIRASKAGVPWPHYRDLVTMARDCDFLIITVPGGNETRAMVDAQVLEALGPEGILVNVARGSVVDQTALIAALQSGRLGGAALDVFAKEPSVPEELVRLDHVVLQPHVGSATLQTRERMAYLMIENLRRHFAGKPLLTAIS